MIIYMVYVTSFFVVSGLIFSLGAKKFGNSAVLATSIVVYPLSLVTLARISPLGLSSVELLAGTLVEIPFRLSISANALFLNGLFSSLILWTLMKYKVQKISIHFFIMFFFPMMVFFALVIDSFVLRMCVLEISSLAVCLFHLGGTNKKEKSYLTLQTGFCASLIFLFLSLEQLGPELGASLLKNIIVILYLFVRVGLFEELFYKFSVKNINNLTRYSSIVLSMVSISTLLNSYLLELGADFPFIIGEFMLFTYAFAVLSFFIINKQENLSILRMAQIKFLLLFGCIANGLISGASLLVHIQVVLFFFIWEAFEKVSVTRRTSASFSFLYWVVVFMFLGPFPLLPLQVRLLEVVKDTIHNNSYFGYIGLAGVIIILSSLPKGLFGFSKLDTEA